MSMTKHGGDAAEDHGAERLLAGLRAVAREEATALASAPIDASAPLSADERGEIAALLLGTPGGARKDPKAKTNAPAEAGVASLAEARLRRRRWLTVAVPLAAAAGLALVLGPLSSNRTRFEPLPDYDVTAEGGLKTVRGGDPNGGGAATIARPERIGRDTELVVHARPATAVDGPLALRAFAIQGGVARELAAQVELAPSGAAEVRVRPGAATVQAGRITLLILIGRVDDVRAATLVEAAASPADANGRRWLTLLLDLAD
jgi:hypothetical protein